MNTDDLIRALATDLAPEPPISKDLWLRLGLALLCCLALVGGILGYRADLRSALLTPAWALRIVLALSLFGFAMPMILHLARPDGALRVRYWPLSGVAGVAGLAVLWALVTTHPADWATAMIGTTIVWCLTTIPVLSILPVTVLMITLRRGATSRPALLGGMAGLAGGSAATAAYALHCIEDSPLFYVTWFGLAIAMVTGTAALIGARVLRW